MSKGKKTLLTIAAIVLLVVGGYKWRYPTYSWHQKLMVEVETPQGVVSGSAVVSVKWRQGPKILPDPPSVTNFVYGEATVVALPDGRYLFALIKGASTLALHTFATSSVQDTTDSRIVPASEVKAYKGEVAPVPPKSYPLLVTFTDINDPKTVKRVDPYDLDAAFGCGSSISRAAPPGPATARPDRPNASSASEMNASTERAAQNADTTVSVNKSCYILKSITLEITNKPVTKGVVEGVLGWWKPENRPVKLGGPMWDWKHPNFNFSNALRISDFIKG